MDTDPNTLAAQTRDVLYQVADVLDAVRPDQADAATPCTEFTVADLRAHIVGWSNAFGAGFVDPGGQAPEHTAATVQGNGAAQVRDAGDRIAAGIADGGAERDLVLADGGEMPGGMALAMVLWEYQVHGWDLARATGQDHGLDPERCETYLQQMLPLDEVLRASGQYGPKVEVPADADAPTRLMAFIGRDPGNT